MIALASPPAGLARVFLVGGALLGFFVAALAGLILLGGPTRPAPSGLRAPAGYVEIAYGRRMAEAGHEVAYFSGRQVSVLVHDAQWQELARKDRFARYRFLADAKAVLLAVQRERGDKVPYVMSIKSAEDRLLLAEETDFNPRIYD